MIAAGSFLDIPPVSGLINAGMSNNVRNTAICAAYLFEFLTPLERMMRTAPAKTGIRAVVEGLSELI
jgi:hypothetical protein